MATTNTTPADLDLRAVTAKGNEYRVVVYVDPFPGLKGSDRVSDTCGRCSGTGYVGWGNLTVNLGGKSGRVCFPCTGTGKLSRLVSSARTTARRAARDMTAANAEAADYAAEAPARELAEFLAAWDEALEVEAARQAKPKGYLAEEGVRLRKVPATVALVRSYESENYVTGAPETKYLVKFDVSGKVAVWFTGWPGELEEGQAVELSGTVKSHGDRDGEEQTILTRCNLK